MAPRKIEHSSKYPSGYKGVYIRKPGIYIANIKFQKKVYHLGTFYCPHTAWKAYQNKFFELYGYTPQMP